MKRFRAPPIAPASVMTVYEHVDIGKVRVIAGPTPLYEALRFDGEALGIFARIKDAGAAVRAAPRRITVEVGPPTEEGR